MSLLDFLLAHLPPPPARVLEIGCGDRGGFVDALAAAGFDTLGVDPRAPEGVRFRAVDFRVLDETFDAIVAVRVLHHVAPLDEAVEKLASLAPLLVVDEFAPERLVGATQEWYEAEHRRLAAAGSPPDAPESLDTWRSKHSGLHPSDLLLPALRSRFEERLLEWHPYFYRWLRSPATENAERTLIDAGSLSPVGYRWVGASTSISSTHVSG